MNKRQIKTIKDDTSSNVVFWHNMKIKNVFKKLQTNEKGLSENEVVLRLEKYGPNKISIVKRFKMLKMLYEQFTDFLVLLLIAAGLISLGLGIANSTSDHLGEEIYDAIAIFTIVLINATIGFIQHFKSDQALKKLKEYFEQNVLIVRNGKEGIIHSSELIPGDIIILEVGDKIPADSRLIEANSFKVDEAALTGESNPITKSLQLVPEESRIHARKNMIYSGCTCVYGRGKAVVVATGLQTEMGKIAELTQVKQEQTPLQKALGKFGKVLGIIILAVCAVVMIVEVLVHIGDIQAGEITLLASLIDGFETAIALAISAVPEGLPAAIVITLAIGVSRMAKRKTIVSRLPAVETLGSVDYICSDKTGTLTRNEMTVKQIWTMEGSTLIEGSGYIVEGDFKQNNQKIKPKENPIIQKLLETAYHCNNAGVMRDNGKITIKGDPTEAALVVVAEKAGFTKKSLLKREHEIFFDSDRKRMTTIHDDNGKKYAFMKGSPLVVLTRSNTIKKNNNKITITKQIQNKIEKANLEMSEKALRVLALAYKEVNDNYDKKNEDDIEDN
ncbi:MAG: cation-translocating P-type ATPase, partial [Candidatus Heimdallarchaeota archaeon]